METGRQADMTAWRALVEKDLKGAPFEKALTTRTPEGITLQPLYVDGPLLPAGTGRAAALHVAVRHDGIRKDTASRLVEDAEGGATAAWLGGVDGGGMESLPGALRRFAVVRVDAPGMVERAAAWLKDHVDASAQVVLPVDPLHAAVCGVASEPVDVVARLHAAMPRGWKLLGISTERHHAAGASAVQEVGIALATGVAYLRTLEVAGMSPADVASRVVFTTAVGTDTFMELCKLRALRLCWARVLQACGAGDTATTVHASGSQRTVTTRDAHVNTLRATSQAFSAILGGADLVHVRPWDELLGSAGSRGARLARNTALVLAMESHLDVVTDPARGSFFLDTLTQDLCGGAWSFFQDVESRGGMRAVLDSGWLLERVGDVASARTTAIRTRRAPITGVSEFPLGVDDIRVSSAAGTTGWPVRRDAEPFEHVRARAEAMSPRPAVHLVRLGTTADATGRLQFARNLYTAGGLAVTEDADASVFDAASSLRDAVARVKAGARAVCLCGPDALYAEHAVAFVRALKDAGAAQVILAGRPGALEQALKDAGLAGFIQLGGDAVASIESILA